MNIIKCTDADLDAMYKNWDLCFEGCVINEENLGCYKKWFEDHNCKMLKEDFYVITGKQMNEKYHLTGSNAYPDDINIMCVKQEDLSNVDAIIIPRFKIGGRWFTDVVDNNAYHEEQNKGKDNYER